MNQANYLNLNCPKKQEIFNNMEQNSSEMKQNNNNSLVTDNFRGSELPNHKIIHPTFLIHEFQYNQGNVINHACFSSTNSAKIYIHQDLNTNISIKSQEKMDDINGTINSQMCLQNQPNNFNNEKRRNTRNRWTQDEESRLIKLVSIIGAREWNKISAIIKTKTAKQCRDHYANCLNPEIKNSFWTIEEEQILLTKYQEYGSHWSKIKPFLPGRTSSMIKNYVSMLLKKKEIVSKETDESQNDQFDETSSSSTSSETDIDGKKTFLNINESSKKNENFNYFDINSLLV